MNELLVMLAGGDLRSDGEANKVAQIVLENPQLLDDLVDGLAVTDDVVRGRTSHAIEWIARSQPEWLVPHLRRLIRISRSDPVAMVRWHMAMTFGDMAIFEDHVHELSECLVQMLDDPSVFVRSWTISSLCIVARLYPERSGTVTQHISLYRNDPSIAIRARVRKALEALTNPDNPLPKGWLKSERIHI